MERIIVVALLVSLCSATSPPFPSVIPLDCNETQAQTEVAINLINEDRDEGFVFKPVRVRSVFQQNSGKLPGGFLYYLDLDVVETECSVLSGKSWKECNTDIPTHEIIFGHCKAIIFIARPWRILKLVNYNCTLSTVPSRVIVRMCPDCPSLISDINAEIKAKADLLVEQYNKESNQTHYFKVDEIERVRTQYVFGPSYFLSFTIKETECLKTQADVILANCNFLKDQEADVGFCKGSIYNSPERKQQLQESCEIYEPRGDKDDHGHRHGHCDHGPDRGNGKGQEKPNAPGAEEPGAAQEGTGEAEDAPSNCGHHKHGHCPHHRGHKHHGCRHDHHHEHPHHHPHSHHHHHHHHDSQNQSHSHDPSDHHHHHHNHTSSNDGSSSEEHSDHKRFEKRIKGSVQFYYHSGEESSVPVPTIVRPPPPPEKPGKHGKYGKHGKPDNIEFPSEHSKLATCPGAPLADLPEIVKNYIFS